MRIACSASLSMKCVQPQRVATCALYRATLATSSDTSGGRNSTGSVPCPHRASHSSVIARSSIWRPVMIDRTFGIELRQQIARRHPVPTLERGVQVCRVVCTRQIGQENSIQIQAQERGLGDPPLGLRATRPQRPGGGRGFTPFPRQPKQGRHRVRQVRGEAGDLGVVNDCHRQAFIALIMECHCHAPQRLAGGATIVHDKQPVFVGRFANPGHGTTCAIGAQHEQRKCESRGGHRGRN